MNETQYKNMLKHELKCFKCIYNVITFNKKYFRIFKDDNPVDKELFLDYLMSKKKNSFKVIKEEKNYIEVEILDLEKYKAPKTELDIKIEKLENELKKLKQKSKLEKAEKRKKDKIAQLKEQLKKMEEN